MIFRIWSSILNQPARPISHSSITTIREGEICTVISVLVRSGNRNAAFRLLVLQERLHKASFLDKAKLYKKTKHIHSTCVIIEDVRPLKLSTQQLKFECITSKRKRGAVINALQKIVQMNAYNLFLFIRFMHTYTRHLLWWFRSWKSLENHQLFSFLIRTRYECRHH